LNVSNTPLMYYDLWATENVVTMETKNTYFSIMIE
jgi:hypothetical protein